MGCRRTDCVERPLSGLFEWLGSFVGSHPVYFLVIPLLLSAVLSGGFTFLRDREDNDIELQFTPRKGPSKKARDFVKDNFPYNDSMFSADRLYAKGKFASVIAVATNSSDVLRDEAFEDIIQLNNKILNITVDNGKLGFSDLCAKASGECVTNEILEIIHYNANGTNQTSITFPVHTYRSKPLFLGSVIGGVRTDANDSVTSARALKLFYNLEDEESTAEATKAWLRAFKRIFSAERNSQALEVSYYTSKSRQEEIEIHTTDGFPLFLITYALAITFSVISCLRLDNVRNKVWMAVIGVVSTGLAVLSSFGLMLYIGVPFVITVANSPFLILGIGLNNMFVLVSDWQHTHVKDPVPRRLAHSYKEAAMSITITSLSEVLKFYIGVTSDFPSVQSFCLYTSTSIIFCYIYTLTFFGAFLALNGRREASNRHWLTCMKIPSEDPHHCSDIYSICCVGGEYDKDTGAEKKQPAGDFFKKYYGPFLVKPFVMAVVLCLYAGYLAVSVYGCLHIQQGIELYDLASDNSHVVTFHRKDRQYFSNYGPNVMIVITEEFPYWDTTKRSQLQACMEDFKRQQFVDEHIYTSWLDSYLSYGHDNHLNLDDKDVFLKNLPSFFELHPYFKQDVNLTGGSVHASRSFIQTVHIDSASTEIEMFNGLKATAGKCTAASLLVYNPAFIFYDQYSVIISSTIKNVGVFTAVMLVVSLLLIPNPLCSLWVTCSIGSVIAGVTGFMALWDVSLDSISMIIFTICIGFTVDFSAHIAYAFASSKKPSPQEKIVEALSNLGYPILQGAISTILGVSVLAVSEFHIFRTFFKIMLLVMSIGMAHGLVFIPVLLVLFTCRSDESKSEDASFIISNR
ncbi:patched domain-containing protein 3-like [Myripristis murdjan]|nr:patched domain-containing protein 3-like [Myripristis murdjan]